MEKYVAEMHRIKKKDSEERDDMKTQIQRKRPISKKPLLKRGEIEEWSLIVTHDNDSLEELCTVLDAERCEIDIAETASVALEKMARRSYILIIIDIALADMSGLKFLEYAQRLSPESVKIMLFENSAVVLALDALKIGADSILRKPVQTKKFLEVLEDKFREKNGSDFIPGKSDVTVVLPVLNEEEAIEQVLKELKDEGYFNVLVVDGYSTDKTVDLARNAGATVITQHGKGKTGALLTAFKHIETPYVLVMDGDYTYSAKDIERFLPFRKEFDQIFGFRMGKENINRLHRLGNWVINTTLNVLFGASLSDVCTGMYMLKTEVARNLELRSRGFDVEVEAAIKNITNGKVTEVPISYRSRLGTRKLSTWRHGISILGSVLGLSLSHNPIFLLSSLSSLFTIPGSLILLREFYQRIIYGNAGWSIEYVWLGLILFIIGLNSFTIALFDLISKKQERRIVRHIKDLTR